MCLTMKMAGEIERERERDGQREREEHHVQVETATHGKTNQPRAFRRAAV